ncbi:hypothetical protein BRYFOR_08207 [Marvinbryantia formatexigens DSM 14469]|uniref:Uncharacterized protein n=1 Tax=Marvinbryantia formatexigens DSM 14469 TaxID=478749 RepID=C6LHU3_9FIRM|nr:hypothetical protein BRYFOR_08207 [Marvinbryantia formatexigens DSM 14469]
MLNLRFTVTTVDTCYVLMAAFAMYTKDYIFAKSCVDDIY